MDLILEDHPIQTLIKIAKANQGAMFNVFHYSRPSDGSKDSPFRPLYSLSEAWLTDSFKAIPAGKELAIASIVYPASGNARHIPFIDFNNDATDSGVEEYAKRLGDKWNMPLEIFETDHSFHAYGDRLLSREKWMQFMGQMLLADQNDVLDTYWVGHSLNKGYSALRLSANTDDTRLPRKPLSGGDMQTTVQKLKQALSASLFAAPTFTVGPAAPAAAPAAPYQGPAGPPSTQPKPAKAKSTYP